MQRARRGGVFGRDRPEDTHRHRNHPHRRTEKRRARLRAAEAIRAGGRAGPIGAVVFAALGTGSFGERREAAPGQNHDRQQDGSNQTSQDDPSMSRGVQEAQLPAASATGAPAALLGVVVRSCLPEVSGAV